MGVLVFVCPTSGHEVVTGIEIDPASYQGLKHETVEIKCSACGLSHNFFQIETRWVDDNIPIRTTDVFRQVEAARGGVCKKAGPLLPKADMRRAKEIRYVPEADVLD